MANNKIKSYRKQAYFSHLLLAAAISLVLAMHIHLLAIGATGEVFGAGIFLLVMFLGLPILIILGAVIFFTFRALDDWKILLLTALAIVLISQWLAAIEPALLISMVLEIIYVGLAFVIGIRALLEIRREQTN